MNIVFDEDKTVSISMKESIKGTIADFPEDVIRNAATPAAKNVFDTSDKSDTVNGPITDDKTKSVTYAGVVRR